MKTIPTETDETMMKMCEEESKIPTIERTPAFKKFEIKKNREGIYTNYYGVKLDVPTMRIMWLLASDLSDDPTISATKLANTLNDYLEEVEIVNGGRFE